MIRVRSWDKWQSNSFRDAQRKRNKRAELGASPRRKTFVMAWVAVAVELDDTFAEFAKTVGGKGAESYLIRVLQYAARKSPFEGEINVERGAFGPVVLTCGWEIVSPAKGRKVYDALLSSGLCVRATSGTHPGLVRDRSASSERYESERESPPSPPHGGGADFGLDAKPIRPRDRDRLGKILDYVVRCGSTQAEQSAAVRLRRRFQSDEMPDAEIRTALARYRHVTANRLAKFAKERSR